MKKRVFGLLVAGVTCGALLAGCGSASAKGDETVAENTAEEAVTEAAEEETVEDAVEEETIDASTEEVVEPEEVVYMDYISPDGWSVKYDPAVVEANETDEGAMFVYTGECAGSCFVSVTTSDKTADEVVEELKTLNESADDVTVNEGILTGTEANKAYWVTPVYSENNGMLEDYIVGEFKDGSITFDFLVHQSGDDAIDIPMNDSLAYIIDTFSLEELAGAGDDGFIDEVKQHIDITGCDTFTNIVDRLGDGMGYANVNIGGEDMLFVSEGTFDNDGVNAAIDSEVFCYKDGIPVSLGFVDCGGTAYPLAEKDGILYVGHNHGMKKYSFADGNLVVVEEASVEYDSEGNGTYTYSVDGEVKETGNDEAEKMFEKLFAEQEETTVIEFQPVQ